jgi:hypothetical protein
MYIYILLCWWRGVLGTILCQSFSVACDRSVPHNTHLKCRRIFHANYLIKYSNSIIRAWTPSKMELHIIICTFTYYYADGEVYSVQYYVKVSQWLATGRWFSQSTPFSSTNETGRRDIAEILLKVALNTTHLKCRRIFHANYLIKYSNSIIRAWTPSKMELHS